MYSQPQDLKSAQSLYHNIARDWPKESNKNVELLAKKQQQFEALTPFQRWQAETMRDQPYHNVQAFILKAESGFGGPSQGQDSSVGYLDPSKHNN
jgi:hypothetical protein